MQPDSLDTGSLMFVRRTERTLHVVVSARSAKHLHVMIMSHEDQLPSTLGRTSTLTLTHILRLAAVAS